MVSDEPFETCRQCSGIMQRVSAENENPLIVECRICVLREYAEFLISPDIFTDDKEVEFWRMVVCREGGKAVWDITEPSE